MLHGHTTWAAAALAALGLVLASSAPRHATAQPAGTASQRPAARQPVGLQEILRERVDRLRYEADRDVRGSHIVLDDWVARYYEGQQFRPAWQDGSRLDELIVALGELRDDGLSPDDYHQDSLMSFRLDHRMGRLTPGERADLDLLATDAFMLALYHLYRGKVDPHTLSSQWNFGERPIAVESGLRQLAERLAAGQVRETFEASRPQHVWYQRGRERLREYRAMAARGGWPTLPDGPTLRPGMKDGRIPLLRRRLTVTHDLATPAAVAAAADPFGGAADPEVFDASLEAAVRHFQVRHGMNADGAVGPATRAALNVPIGERIDQIRVNLERARWTLHEIKGDFVLVDVAGFYVSYFRDDEPIWTSKVVVGRDERETPIFRSTITYVVFNPTWTIPPGILVKDKLPELKRNPGALKRMNIRVLDGSGREVDPYTVDWHRYGPGRLPPYQFRQDSGADNALGLVKIMFPNPYLVYLHDSPAKSLYDRDQRTFSSGCIRVQKAFELAELVLNDPQWDDVAIQRAVAGGETRTVTLQKPVPVLLLYWTAQPTPDGQVYFRGDAYDRDAPTLRALDGSFGPPGTMSAAT